MNLSYTVSENENGRTVKWLLQNRLQLSGRLINKLKFDSKILVNKNPVHVNFITHEGDLLETLIEFEEENEYIIPQEMPLDIIYEDSSLIALNKAPGIVVHPTSYHPDGTYANGLAAYFKKQGETVKIRPVSRLDRDTTGAIVFAKNAYIQERLIKQMQNDTYEKKYLGAVWGNFSDDTGVIDLPIARMPGSIMLRHISEEGARAVTEYKIIDRYEAAALLEFKLLTGRTHQIRVHCQAIGHPLIGDTLYSDITTELIGRQALHSYFTSFIHPLTEKKLELIAPLPADFEMLLSKLKLNK